MVEWPNTRFEYAYKDERGALWAADKEAAFDRLVRTYRHLHGSVDEDEIELSDG